MPSNIFGIILSLMAVGFGLLTGILVKLISQDVPLATVLMGRFWASLPVLFGIAIWMRGSDWLHVSDKKTLGLRIIFGLCGISFWFLSVRHIPIGLATSLFQSSVIFITLLSPFFLGERVGIYRWSAVIIGLLGVILITDPFRDGLPAGVVFGVLAAISGASLSITLRRLGKKEHPLSVASLYNFAGAIIATLLVLVIPGQYLMPSQTDIVLICCLGVIGSFLQICMTSAYRYTDATIIAIMRYLQVPGAILVGFLAFAEVPSAIQFLGTAIVVAASLFIIMRELYLGKHPSKDEDVRVKIT